MCVEADFILCAVLVICKQNIVCFHFNNYTAHVVILINARLQEVKGHQHLFYSHYPADEGGNNVLLKKMVLVVEGRPDIELDLTGKLKVW